ncbi:hypothetical protein [Streptomyces sp. cg2]|uniref:hypothetical protein n=1 Tax=Streptomyces sp. cg2 TaxID=3238799 RepID=UPI0034E25D70
MSQSRGGCTFHDSWFYPSVLDSDLQGTDLPDEIKAETRACAWEYIRCVVPEFTNWNRYVALARIIIIGIVAEFHGGIVDIVTDRRPLGYDLDELLDTIFAGTPGHEAMSREYRTFLVVTAEKASENRNSELFRRYVNALVHSPKDWFRLRDCDALARFTMTAALTCNDVDDEWFSEEEFQILTELGDTLYDAVAYYKHRAEGETNSTFAYVGGDLRSECYRQCREVLWALDATWAPSRARRHAVNFLRYFGGPIHMMMRRYRFTEEGLTIGRTETERVVHQTRENFKLWYRVDATDTIRPEHHLDRVASQQGQLLFPGFLKKLENARTPRCHLCRYRTFYGAEASGKFGGVELCRACREEWRSYLTTFPDRAAEVLPITRGLTPTR